MRYLLLILLLFGITPRNPHVYVMGDRLTPTAAWAGVVLHSFDATNQINALGVLPDATEGDIVIWAADGATPPDTHILTDRGAAVYTVGRGSGFNVDVTGLTDDAAIAAAILTPNLTAQWSADQRVLRLTWQAPGWHCLYIDNHPLTCGANSGALELPSGGVDVAYAPIPGRTLTLVDSENTKTAQGVVPARVFRVWVTRVVR